MASTLTSALQFQTGNVSAQPFVLTGPVIGMVTATTARVLVEANVACTLECECVASGGQPPLRLTLRCPKRRPVAFEFEGLQPETFYRVNLSLPVPGLVAAGFMTMAENWSLMEVPARIAVVAGNSARYGRDCVSNQGDLWKSLFKLAYKGQIDYLLHLGDNVDLDPTGADSRGSRGSGHGRGESRGDSRWHEGLRLLAAAAPSEWEDMREDLCELFRGAYRETWNQAAVKQTLANVPNLMLLNEGEICQQFGGAPEHEDPRTAEFLLAQCAYQVYNEYQRQLFETIDPADPPTQAYHFHVLGDLGIMMVDTRVARTIHLGEGCHHWEKDGALPLLGHRQWRDIEFALSDTGYFAGCRMLLVCSPTPTAWVGDSGVKAACQGAEPSVAGHWFGQRHGPEASYFLAGLYDWRAKKPGLREVCLVGAGAGEGFVSEVVDLRYCKLGDKRVDRMKQIVLAPVAGAPSPMQKNMLKKALGTAIGSLAPYHQFKHHKHMKKVRQFALFDIYLNYDDKLPQLGVQTCFTIQVTGTNGTSKKTLSRPIDSTKRERAAFQTTHVFGVCDGKQLPPEEVDWDEMKNGSAVPAPPYELRSAEPIGSSYASYSRYSSYTPTMSSARA